VCVRACLSFLPYVSSFTEPAMLQGFAVCPLRSRWLLITPVCAVSWRYQSEKQLDSCLVELKPSRWDGITDKKYVVVYQNRSFFILFLSLRALNLECYISFANVVTDYIDKPKFRSVLKFFVNSKNAAPYRHYLFIVCSMIDILSCRRWD
jgi:hypothetical protein